MKKPIATPYTIVWVEVPDQPEKPPRSRGTRAPGSNGIGAWRRAKARIARAWEGSRLSGAIPAAGLVPARG